MQRLTDVIGIHAANGGNMKQIPVPGEWVTNGEGWGHKERDITGDWPDY